MEEEIEKYQIEKMYRFKAIDGSKKEENNINFEIKHGIQEHSIQEESHLRRS